LTPNSYFAAAPIGAIESLSGKGYLGDDDRPLLEILNIMYSVRIRIEEENEERFGN